MNKKNLKSSSTSGFTMLELLSAVAIVGVLAALAIPAYKQYQAKAKTAEAKAGLSAVYTAEKTFFQQESSYTGCVGRLTERIGTGYYSIGFSNNAVNGNTCGRPLAGGTNNTQSCKQLCYDIAGVNRCSTNAAMACTPGAGQTFIENQMGTAVDLTVGFTSASLSSLKFVAIAAANESDLTARGFDLVPTAFATGGYDMWAIDNNKNLYSLGSPAASP